MICFAVITTIFFDITKIIISLWVVERTIMDIRVLALIGIVSDVILPPRLAHWMHGLDASN